ncbi:hypothetical protein HO173_005720 [Letharia columbiana]|uniref:MYND-type domain-containing protein n=1 Tax=Letharia columbiana TaxID=112416 RepID=A0A8H6L5B4_9LECA|nr:uncharacterized protein HO173_005720 [Letharia columbiana]KAF6236092.1 hypothetical protein HO173_005720 [Letharia columbiana]
MSLEVNISQLAQGRIPCANVKEGVDGPVNCVTQANLICSRCYLVQYCSYGCQVTHWPQHKLDCNSALRKPGWQPTWASEGRRPAFMSTAMPSESFGHLRFLYGNIAAFDVLKLAHNEGTKHNKDLNLCFAASGDLRNIIESVIGMPDDYSGTCLCVVNDKDQLVVARNVVMLLTSLVFPPVIAAVLILHIWYSARLTPKMLQDVKDRVRPLIAEVLKKIEQKKDDVLLHKTWTFGTRMLSLRLYKQQWNLILRLFDAEQPVSKGEEERQYVMLNDTRVDYRERRLFTMSPSRRVCSHKMQESGMLLPFGSCSDGYTSSNPTLFDNDSGAWLLKDSADPLAGWALKDILASGVRRGGPKEDIYGHLHFHIRDLLENFCQKTTLMKIHMDMYCVNATELPSLLDDRLKESAFDRIEISNIADANYIGLEKSLSTFGPLLKNRKQSSHATLITLFMNAAEQAAQARGYDIEAMMTGMQKISQFLPSKLPANQNPYNPAALRASAAKDLVRDYDKLWAQYKRMLDFPTIVKKTGMKPKVKNTVVEAWPMRLYKRYGEPGAQEDFDNLMESGSSGNERYVEWMRSE